MMAQHPAMVLAVGRSVALFSVLVQLSAVLLPESASMQARHRS